MSPDLLHFSHYGAVHCETLFGVPAEGLNFASLEYQTQNYGRFSDSENFTVHKSTK